MQTFILTLILIGVLLNLAISYLGSKHKDNIANLRETKNSLEKDVRTLGDTIEKDRERYSKEREYLIEENKAYKLQIEYYERELSRFSEADFQYKSEMDNLSNYSREMSPEELLELRSKANKANSNVHDFTGIYILENKTVDKFYVGQSISLFKRAGAHFAGDGNEDIYTDYKNGEKWTVRLIALADSGFKSINALEKHFIEYYHSTYNGYNKTIGNAN